MYIDKIVSLVGSYFSMVALGKILGGKKYYQLPYVTGVRRELAARVDSL